VESKTGNAGRGTAVCRSLTLGLLALTIILIAGCARQTTALAVGSYSSTERMILAEIAAQVLEKQTGAPVIRRFDAAGTQDAYQSLMLGNLDVYPEDAVSIVVKVLKETVDPNPDVAFERVRGEMVRLARIQALNPLGIHSRIAMVIRAADQKDGGIQNLSRAAGSGQAWTVGYTSEFESRLDGYSALMSTYKLPLKVAAKPYPPGALYPALAGRQVTMISAHDTDGPLLGSNFVALKDDMEAFRESLTCLLVRQGALDADPRIRPSLDRLSGKFTSESIQKLNYQVDVRKRPVKDVATEFLRTAGL